MPKPWRPQSWMSAANSSAACRRERTTAQHLREGARVGFQCREVGQVRRGDGRHDQPRRRQTPRGDHGIVNGLPGKGAVLDPVRLGRVVAQAAALVFLIGLEIALEPLDMRVAFEGQDMGRQTVQEPAIMGDDDRAAGGIP